MIGLCALLKVSVMTIKDPSWLDMQNLASTFVSAQIVYFYRGVEPVHNKVK